jgi:hypothetical protein
VITDLSPCSCRPYGAPFFGGLVAPFALIYILNWIIFVLIFVSLLRKRRNSEVGVKKDDMKMKVRQQFIIALTLSVLFGLGWGVGFATTSGISSVPLSATLQAIFILLTAFQGFYIFIMHCIRVEEARNVWKEWVYILTCHKVALDAKKLTGHATATRKPKPHYSAAQTLASLKSAERAGHGNESVSETKLLVAEEDIAPKSLQNRESSSPVKNTCK